MFNPHVVVDRLTQSLFTVQPSPVKPAAYGGVAASPWLTYSGALRVTGSDAVMYAMDAADVTGSISHTTPSNPYKFGVFVLNVTACPAGTTIQVDIAGWLAAGVSYPILSNAGALIAAPGVYAYRVGPGLVPAANAVANEPLPEFVTIACTKAGAGVIAYRRYFNFMG